MSYSLDLRKKVVNYVENGGSITAAAKHYQISRTTVYRWFQRENLAPTKTENRQRKLDWKALEKDVKENPDSRLVDRAKKFGVTINAIYYALKKMKITRKKKNFKYEERDHESRIKYCQQMRALILMFGVQSLVFIDESGFIPLINCPCGWSKKGKKIFGNRPGKRQKRQNFVAGRRKGKKDFIAPMIFEGSMNADVFEKWLKIYLLPSLEKFSVLIMDNAPIHRKAIIRRLVQAAGHYVLFLPPYSPDLNDIEHDFSALKRAMMYAPSGTSLDQVIRDYCIS
jgi:transposase